MRKSAKQQKLVTDRVYQLVSDHWQQIEAVKREIERRRSTYEFWEHRGRKPRMERAAIAVAEMEAVLETLKDIGDLQSRILADIRESRPPSESP